MGRRGPRVTGESYSLNRGSTTWSSRTAPSASSCAQSSEAHSSVWGGGGNLVPKCYFGKSEGSLDACLCDTGNCPRGQEPEPRRGPAATASQMPGSHAGKKQTTAGLPALPPRCGHSWSSPDASRAQAFLGRAPRRPALHFHYPSGKRLAASE